MLINTIFLEDSFLIKRQIRVLTQDFVLCNQTFDCISGFSWYNGEEYYENEVRYAI